MSVSSALFTFPITGARGQRGADTAAAGTAGSRRSDEELAAWASLWHVSMLK